MLRLRIRVPRWFLVALLASISSFNAAQAREGFAIVLENEHPHEALADLLSKEGLEIVLIGDPFATVSMTANERTLDSLVRTVARQAGYVVTRRGRAYLLYGDNPETEIGEQLVTISHPLREMTAEVALEQLSKFEGIQASFLRDNNAIILRGSLDEIKAALSFLDTIDQVRPNVFLELLVVEYFHGDAFTWKYDVVDATRSHVSEGMLVPGFGLLTGLYEFVADLPLSFRLNLAALIDENDARVVTNPHVAVRTGETGRIDFKEELHVVLTNEAGNFGTTQTLKELGAGVMLEVVPLVTGSGRIQLDVRAEVGVFTNAPQGQFAIDRQQIETKVLIDERETLILGGLVKHETVEQESGFPILRRIPLLGFLFRNQVKRESYIETVIYITPYINDQTPFLPENIGRDAESALDEAGRFSPPTTGSRSKSNARDSEPGSVPRSRSPRP